jgi:hypothetical protein
MTSELPDQEPAENAQPLEEGTDEVDDGLAGSEESERPSIDDALSEGQAGEEFKPGDALSHVEAAELCAEVPTTVVVLAGGVRSGKTTLLTAIYEHFNQETLAGWLFAGSRTLFGFERRCHGGRQESGFDAPRTERSSRLQPPWLHLEVAADNPANPDLRRNLLLADVTGELFEELVTGARRASDLPEIWRADHLAIVLDGRKLSTPEEEQAERMKMETLARVLIEQEALVTPDALSIVVTKLDEILARESHAVDKLDAIADRIRQAAGITQALPVWRTAARPQTSELAAGHGVVALFTSWLEVSSRARKHPPRVSPLPQTYFANFPAEGPA